jgi:peptidoglycan/LPS O-acetylase OafA/YrhL
MAEKSRSSFWRLPHQGTRIVELDFVRGIAILLVVGAHTLTVKSSQSWPAAVDYVLKHIGGSGVDLFFVLSGFLVGGLLIREYKQTQQIDAGRFILRRGFKIWPAYYAYLLLEVLTRSHPLHSFLWQGALHLQNYTGTTLLSTWSLSVEEHFYLLLAFLLAWAVRRHCTPQNLVRTLLLILAAVPLLRTLEYVLWGARAATHHTECRIDQLTAGVLLALLFHFYPHIFQQLAKPVWALLPLLALPVGWSLLVESPALLDTLGIFLTEVGAAALLLLVYAHSARLRTLRVYRWIALVGVYSYGIYLFHTSCRSLCLKLTLHLPALLQPGFLLAAQYGVAILTGILATHLVEWPALRLRNRLFPPRADSPQPEQSPAAVLSSAQG